MQVSRWGQRRRGLHLGFAVRAQSRPTFPQTEPSRRRLRRQHRGARVQHRAQALQVPGLLRLHSGRRGARPGPLLRARRSHLLSALAPRLHEDNRQRAKGGGGRSPGPLEVTTAAAPTPLGPAIQCPLWLWRGDCRAHPFGHCKPERLNRESSSALFSRMPTPYSLVELPMTRSGHIEPPILRISSHTWHMKAPALQAETLHPIS